MTDNYVSFIDFNKERSFIEIQNEKGDNLVSFPLGKLKKKETNPRRSTLNHAQIVNILNNELDQITEVENTEGKKMAVVSLKRRKTT